MEKNTIIISDMNSKEDEKQISSCLRENFATKRIMTSCKKHEVIFVTDSYFEEDRVRKLIESLGYTIKDIKCGDGWKGLFKFL